MRDPRFEEFHSYGRQRIATAISVKMLTAHNSRHVMLRRAENVRPTFCARQCQGCGTMQVAIIHGCAMRDNGGERQASKPDLPDGECRPRFTTDQTKHPAMVPSGTARNVVDFQVTATPARTAARSAGLATCQMRSHLQSHSPESVPTFRLVELRPRQPRARIDER